MVKIKDLIKQGRIEEFKEVIKDRGTSEALVKLERGITIYQKKSEISRILENMRHERNILSAENWKVSLLACDA